MKPSKVGCLGCTASVFPNGNDDTSDTAESRLQVQQVLIIVLIMGSRGYFSQCNQIVTGKLLR